MDLENIIRNRRSIRRYLSNDIDAETIGRLIECGRLCQSAKNRQPWKIMVLKGETKNQIADIMLTCYKPSFNDRANSAAASAAVIKNAPLLFLIFQEVDEAWQTSDLVSIGAMIEHICLEAVHLGLGSLWIRDTVYTEAKIVQAVGYPELRLISAIAIGKPAETPAPRPRKTTAQILLKEKTTFLTTQRCRLAHAMPADFENLMPFYTDSLLRTFLGGSLSDNQAQQNIRAIIADTQGIHLTVKLNDGTLIGLIEITPHHNMIDKEISYIFLKEYWSQGYAFECLQAVLEYCRTQLKLTHILIETQSKNIASRKLAEKLNGELKQKLIRFNEEQCIYVINL